MQRCCSAASLLPLPFCRWAATPSPLKKKGDESEGEKLSTNLPVPPSLRQKRYASTHQRDVNTEELDHLVTGERETPLVIDFCADWCGSCDILSEQLEELAEEYDGRVRFVQVNTDQEYDLADQLEIRGLPTMVFMGKDKAKRATRIEGMLSVDTIRQLIDDVADLHT
ncbi:unnamed protein product [Closterium sp. Naga37s-1]|nr:unnamed protein product [Closterium sp. Naga37s-1]